MLQPLKPAALRPGDAVRIVSLASPVDEESLERGCAELKRLGYAPRMDRDVVLASDSYFAGATLQRLAALKQALVEPETKAIFCSRGGYGSNYLLDDLGRNFEAPRPKILFGYSDISSLQIFLWQKLRWVTFYGPMVASGFDGGVKGYDQNSFCAAVSQNADGWTVDLQGKALLAGGAEGILAGGCLTLVETTLGTPWEIDTTDTILVLEDRGMKPYQVDRALMHLKQAGKLRKVRGIILGEFPQCTAADSGESVRDVVMRILTPLEHRPTGLPVVVGAAVGHSERPMLTLPLGVRARLSASASNGEQSGTRLEILESAVG
ncbi:MAG TPA: LD-carboxypeptidase [Candidatus Acidoferrum sp.]|nr:LD-carboxypeptidase [Candidatus Acidoferrum sp.]